MTRLKAVGQPFIRFLVRGRVKAAKNWRQQDEVAVARTQTTDIHVATRRQRWHVRKPVRNTKRLLFPPPRLQAEGVQADCERRLNEYERLRGDFSSLEETHRGLLVEMEGLNRAKEQAEAAVAELRRQLFTEQEKRDQMRQQIEVKRTLLFV